MKKWFSRGDCFKQEYDKLNCPKCNHHFGVGNLGSFGSDYVCPSCNANLVIWETIPVNFYILKDEAPPSVKHLIEYMSSLRSNEAKEALEDLMQLFGTSDFAEGLKKKE